MRKWTNLKHNFYIALQTHSEDFLEKWIEEEPTFIGCGDYADVFSLGENVVRFSKDLVRPLPFHIRINPRLGFISYDNPKLTLEIFPKLVPALKTKFSRNSLIEMSIDLQNELTNDGIPYWDIFLENLGFKCNLMKILDPGCILIDTNGSEIERSEVYRKAHQQCN